MLADNADGPLQLLHVDDDSAFLDLTAAFLERELDGVTVDDLADPASVTERLTEVQYDCVISDYDMPEMDGLELFAEIRERNPDLPFVLYTGKGSETIASQAINAGVTGYFQKGGPDQHRRLANRVEHAAEEYRAKRTSQRYSTILDALDYPTYVVDPDARFAHVNEAFAELTGYSRAELIGSEPAIIKSEESVERADEALRRAVSSDGADTQQFDIEVTTKDGETVYCRDHLAPLPFEEEYRGCAGILRDTTEERARQRELQAQNERLEEFFSVISHDLRTPLTTAETAAQMARETGEETYFEELSRAHDRMSRMLEDLLTLAREANTSLEVEQVDLRALAEAGWDSVCSTDATLTVRDDATLEAEPERLRRLLENLFQNALHHAGPDVSVTVDVTDDGFFVADDGPGIPEEAHEQVFKPGYTTADDGSGFGLSIVRRIADAHDWSVAVEESREGGVRFTFTEAERVHTTPELAED